MRPWGLVMTTARSSCVLLVLGCLGALTSCGDGRSSSLGDGKVPAGGGYDQGPCDDGQQRECAITIDRANGFASCLQAGQVCHDGAWGECGEVGPVYTTRVAIPPANAGQLSTRALGPTTDCQNNPCDPYCQTFIDELDDGGISIPPDPDGGVLAPDISGSAFAGKANYNGACSNNGDCNLDQYCAFPAGSTEGTCTSWGEGEFNPECAQPPVTYGALTPKPTCKTQDSDGYNDYSGGVSSGQFDAKFSAPALFVAAASLSSTGSGLSEGGPGPLKFFDALGTSGGACNLRLKIPNAFNYPADPDGFAKLTFGEGQQPLLVDLNGDSVPEVVALDGGGAANWYDPLALSVPQRILAFSVASTGSGASISYSAVRYAGWRDPANRTGRAWQSGTVPTGTYGGTFGTRVNGTHAAVVHTWGYGGLGAQDLDGDGTPEIIAGQGYVFNASGQLIALPPVPGGSNIYKIVEQHEAGPILADIDGDGKVEMIIRQGVFEFVPGSGWVAESGFNWPKQGAAFVPSRAPDFFSRPFFALADFGAFGSTPNTPEIAWVSENRVRVMASDGSPVFGFASTVTPAPTAALAGDIVVPGGGGGPVNIGDFDGDGLPEIGIAGGAFYSVFDIDCVSGTSARTFTRGGQTFTGTCNRSASNCDCLATGDCTAGGPDVSCAKGILWSRRTQDQSSAVTGSTVFDFNADGKGEVVYADECWTRVYDGATGTVVFSGAHSSGTIVEQPTVADVNLDGRANLLVPNQRVLESTSGEGMYCPSSVLWLPATWQGWSWAYETPVEVARAGQSVTVRWYDWYTAGQACLIRGATWRCANSVVSWTLSSNVRATITLAAGDPVGGWTLRVRPQQAFTQMDLWLQGFALRGTTEPVKVGGTANGLGTDSFFAGLSCTTLADCPTTAAPMTCDTAAKLCRCTADAQCGVGFKCIDSVGGKACRPTRSYGTNSGITGIQVWSGPGQGWAQSRYVWNQHA